MQVDSGSFTCFSICALRFGCYSDRYAARNQQRKHRHRTTTGDLKCDLCPDCFMASKYWWLDDPLISALYFRPPSTQPCEVNVSTSLQALRLRGLRRRPPFDFALTSSLLAKTGKNPRRYAFKPDADPESKFSSCTKGQ